MSRSSTRISLERTSISLPLKNSNENNNKIIDASSVKYEGYLTKRGHVLTNWKTRYFILSNDNIYYYTDEYSYKSNGKLLGQVEIDRVAQWNGEKYGFIIHSLNKIPYYLYASSENSKLEWFEALEKFIVKLDPVDVQGSLSKRGHLVPSYRKKYFVLSGKKLRVYNDDQSYHSNEPPISESLIKTIIEWNGESNGIMFDTSTDTNFYAYAENKHEQSKWLNAIPQPKLDDISCAGSLTKQGHKMKSWKKRYFVLRGDILSYFHDYSNAKNGLKVIAELRIKSVSTWDGHKFGFVILTTEDIKYYIYADNEQERKKWIVALNKVTAKPERDTTSIEKKQCPKCSALLTGSRFCGACGYNFITKSSPRLRKPLETSKLELRKSSIVGPHIPDVPDIVTEDPIEESEVEKLDALSEGARTLLLAIMKYPEGINDDYKTSFSSNEESGKTDNISFVTPPSLLPENSKKDKKVEKGEFRLDIDLEANKESENILDSIQKSKEISKVNVVVDDTSFDESSNSPTSSEYKSITDCDFILDSRGIVDFDPPKEIIQSAAKMTIKQYLERRFQFVPIYIPSKDAPVRCRIYGSMNYSISSKLILFISDSGPIGMWEQPISNETENGFTADHSMTMVNYFAKAFEEGYGIMLCNPFCNHVSIQEEGNSRSIPIPQSSTPNEHINFVWQNYLNLYSGKLSIVAYGKGGALFKSLLESFTEQLLQKVVRVALIESCHNVDGNEPGEVLQFLGRRCINWEKSINPLGSQIVDSQMRLGCICLSSGSGSSLESSQIERSKESIYAFLRADPLKKGMTPIVGYIRSVIRDSTKNKSNIILLGESDNKAKKIMNKENKMTKFTEKVSEKKEKIYESPRDVSMKDFELLNLVGRGGFGKVFLAKKKTEPLKDKMFALKVLQKEKVLSSGLVQTTMAERHILTQIQHPFIVKLYYAFQSFSKLNLVIDYLSGGSLAYHLKRRKKFPENMAKFYAAEIASAMAHLHKLNIIYRDAKLENVLLDHTGHACITDFGLSKVGVSGLDGAKTFCGTAAYIAPELLHGKPYGIAADWWSFGILLYEMIGGKPPYYHKNREIMFQTILKQEWVTFTPSFSDSAVSIIRGLLTRDPSKRLGSGSRGSYEVFEHKFFQEIDWKLLIEKKIDPPFNPGIGKYDVYFTPHHVNVNDVTENDLQHSVAKNDDFDGFSFANNY